MSIYYNIEEYEHLKAERHPAQADAFKNREFYVRSGPHHKGIQEFVFWSVPQIQYKNPNVQIVAFKNMTPSPFIECYLDDGDFLSHQAVAYVATDITSVSRSQGRRSYSMSTHRVATKSSSG